MNCPKCNKEMKSGYIRTTGRGGICWVNEKTAGAPAADPGFEVLGKAKYFAPCCIKAWKCPDCRIVVADYSEY